MRRRRKTIRPPFTMGLLFLAATAIILLGYARFAVAAAAALSERHTLVIDPGHGGLDGGASAADGTKESGVNLSIALRMRDLCALFGLPCEMTRTEETLPYPPEAVSVHEKKVWDQQRRLSGMREAQDPVFLSIHQNFYPDERPRGIQVLYAASEGSEQFGSVTHGNLLRCLCPESRRVVMPAPRDIYLLKQAECPAILVECGFLSNPTEAGLLTAASYQTKIAVILLASYLEYAQSAAPAQEAAFP